MCQLYWHIPILAFIWLHILSSYSLMLFCLGFFSLVYVENNVQRVGNLHIPSPLYSNLFITFWFFTKSHSHNESLFRSDQISRSVMSDSLQTHELQHARPPCPSPTPGVHSDSCALSWWCHPAISSSVVIHFSSCPQSLPASESFPMSQLFAWGGQSTRVSALTSILPMNTQDWSPLGWTGWISLQSKGLSRVFSNTTVQKHQFFGTQPSSQSNSHIHTWLLGKL